jgi:hypothetical protein
MSDSQPHNRRERRAAARSKPTTTTTNEPLDILDIPMATPDWTAKPTGKTLLDLAEERRAQLSGGTPFPKSTPSSSDDEPHRHRDGDFEFMSDDPLPPFANAVLYTISLCALHLTLDVLALTQYQQPVVWREIFGRLASVLPALLAVVYMFHRPEVRRWGRTRQGFFWAVAVAAGVYLIHAANEYGYYFVMKRAPPLGMLWVWAVVEMELVVALVHVVVVAAFMWVKGYKAF